MLSSKWKSALLIYFYGPFIYNESAEHVARANREIFHDAFHAQRHKFFNFRNFVLESDKQWRNNNASRQKLLHGNFRMGFVVYASVKGTNITRI